MDCQMKVNELKSIHTREYENRSSHYETDFRRFRASTSFDKTF